MIAVILVSSPVLILVCEERQLLDVAAVAELVVCQESAAVDESACVGAGHCQTWEFATDCYMLQQSLESTLPTFEHGEARTETTPNRPRVAAIQP